MRVGFGFAVDVVDFGRGEDMHLATTDDAAKLNNRIHPSAFSAGRRPTLQRAIAAHHQQFRRHADNRR